jgi:hypothetical protein
MSLATLTTKELSRIQRLIEQKEALAQKVAEINSELEAMESGVSAPRPAPTPIGPVERVSRAAAPRPMRRKGGKTRRGELKAGVIAELKAAGSEGIRVKDLAAKLGTRPGNVSVFFRSTGKKIREIKKIGRGLFAWKGA